MNRSGFEVVAFLLRGRAALSKHRALPEQTGEDSRARLMMGSTQLTYTCIDTNTGTPSRQGRDERNLSPEEEWWG